MMDPNLDLTPTRYNGPKHSPRKDISPLKSCLKNSKPDSAYTASLQAQYAHVFRQRQRLKLAYKARDAGNFKQCISLCDALLRDDENLSLRLHVEVLHLLAQLKQPVEGKQLLERAKAKLDAACAGGEEWNFLELRLRTKALMEEVERKVNVRAWIEDAEDRLFEQDVVECERVVFEIVEGPRSNSEETTEEVPGSNLGVEDSLENLSIGENDESSIEIQRGKVIKKASVLKLRTCISRMLRRGKEIENETKCDSGE